MIAAPPRHRAQAPAAEWFRRVAEVSALCVFAVALSGTAVRAVGAAWACQGGFPDCNGLGPLPFGRNPLADIQLYHRLLSYVAFGLAAWLVVEALHTQTRRLRRTSLAVFGSTVAAASFGAASVSVGNPPLIQVLHATASSVSWFSAVALVVVAHRDATVREAVSSRTLLAYVQLTKPRV